jgi:hypothetical protein
MANSYLTRTPSSGGNRKTFTISTWFKRSKLSTTQILVQAATDGSTYSQIRLRSDDMLQFYSENGGVEKINLKTNRVLRDTNAWYNVVLAVDTTQGTASDRVKLYINGVQETSFATATYGDQNYDTQFNHTVAHTIGRRDAYGDMYFDGYQSHFALVDGAALTPTSFGSTDSTSGIWKFKSPSGVTFGTNGVHLKFENSANLGLDSSGNTNNMTVNGNLKQALDTPSNVSVTMNPLDYWYRNPALSMGNTKIVDTTGWSGARGTFGFSTGKWYWEIKLTGSMDNHIHGVQLVDVNTRAQDPQQITGTTVFYNHDGGEMRVDGTQTTADYGTFSSGDIMGVAVDMTAGSYGQITIYKNGSAIVSNFNLSSSSTTIMPFSAVGNCTTEYNFGNGYFGTTAISSAGSNGNGSLFEYDVPSGYYALNTKNLNTYG